MWLLQKAGSLWSFLPLESLLGEHIHSTDSRIPKFIDMYYLSPELRHYTSGTCQTSAVGTLCLCIWLQSHLQTSEVFEQPSLCPLYHQLPELTVLVSTLTPRAPGPRPVRQQTLPVLCFCSQCVLSLSISATLLSFTPLLTHPGLLQRPN